jgi:hypothetical protein
VALYQGTTSQLAEKLNRSSLVSGHGFSRADNANKMCWALAPADPSSAGFAFRSDFFRNLFSRANKANKMTRALAPEGWISCRISRVTPFSATSSAPANLRSTKRTLVQTFPNRNQPRRLKFCSLHASSRIGEYLKGRIAFRQSCSPLIALVMDQNRILPKTGSAHPLPGLGCALTGL